MAGRGRAPKHPENRRNTTTPQLGEWVELPLVETKHIPRLPARGPGRGKWSPRTRLSWKAWWSDPVSAMWGESDEDLVLQLADVFEEFVRACAEGRGAASLASEARQLRDSLGLTPKGRQDRRWRLMRAHVTPIREPQAPADELAAPATGTRARVRAVDPAGG